MDKRVALIGIVAVVVAVYFFVYFIQLNLYGQPPPGPLPDSSGWPAEVRHCMSTCGRSPDECWYICGQCGDEKCDATHGENQSNCPQDCTAAPMGDLKTCKKDSDCGQKLNVLYNGECVAGCFNSNAAKDPSCNSEFQLAEGKCKCVKNECIFETLATSCTDECGDGECDYILCKKLPCPCLETRENCPQDCTTTGCGDGKCNGAETKKTCPQDCGGEVSEEILVSFRVDDPYFGEEERPFLETIVSLAREYSIKLDIAVVAWPFDHLADPEVFGIYTNNTDVLGIVAHGYRHTEVENWTYGWGDDYTQLLPGDHNEFGSMETPIPRDKQEERIRSMQEVFSRHNLVAATQVFLTPFGNGNRDTVDLAHAYGYKYINTEAMGVPECLYGDTIVTSSAVVAAPSIDSVERIINSGHDSLTVIFHPGDLHSSKLVDLKRNFFDKLKDSRYYSRMKFGFISEQISGGYLNSIPLCPGNDTVATCGDGYCDSAAGEKTSCPQDCHL